MGRVYIFSMELFKIWIALHQNENLTCNIFEEKQNTGMPWEQMDAYKQEMNFLSLYKKTHNLPPQPWHEKWFHLSLAFHLLFVFSSKLIQNL